LANACMACANLRHSCSCSGVCGRGG
jgi:hypothetical protein